MAKSTSRFICLLPKRRSAQLGFERYLPGNDAIHGSAANWTYIDIPIPATCTLATSSYGGIMHRGRSNWIAHFCHYSKICHLKVASSENIDVGSPDDVKIRKFGKVSFIKNGVGSIFTIKNQLAPHPQIPGDQRKLATPHEWPHPSAVSCNQP